MIVQRVNEHCRIQYFSKLDWNILHASSDGKTCTIRMWIAYLTTVNKESRINNMYAFWSAKLTAILIFITPSVQWMTLDRSR